MYLVFSAEHLAKKNPGVWRTKLQQPQILNQWEEMQVSSVEWCPVVSTNAVHKTLVCVMIKHCRHRGKDLRPGAEEHGSDSIFMLRGLEKRHCLSCLRQWLLYEISRMMSRDTKHTSWRWSSQLGSWLFTFCLHYVPQIMTDQENNQ